MKQSNRIKKLEKRIIDYENMIKNVSNPSAYKKPGSLKK